ncbi:hypothetical protein DFH05DRAFT_1533309 [Lentinula detonsa]|uniref:Uncharacterized protein n=1 Tax=Lentinula detonsa TaxID=2804962 RepID=A0A9W8P9S7_9AGAR|nr:hypothetical protein DFH05DRAFT_1533309 [Lentinula detonsa]
MNSEIEIEVEETTEFDPSVWIGTGKNYTEVPLHVNYACACVLELPEQVLERLPVPEQPTIPMSICIDQVLRRPIPSPDTLDMLAENFGQGWLDGMNSVRDPRYRGEDFMPLWVVGLWKRLQHLAKIQEDYKEAWTTFSSPATFFGQRGWDTPVTIADFTFATSSFTKLLRPVMINDDITHRLAMDVEQKKNHYLAASRFGLVLQVATTKKRFQDNNLPTALRDIETEVDANPCLKVWFPVLLQMHEVAFCVDFGQSTIAYGDSLSTMPPPTAVVAYIEKWLKARFHRTFKNTGNSLAHAWQKDSISCIPVTMNTILHGIFGDPLWTHENRYLDCLKWFSELVPDQQQDSTSLEAEALEDIFQGAVDDLLGGSASEPTYNINTTGTIHSSPTEKPVNIVEPSQPPKKGLNHAWSAMFHKKPIPDSKKRSASPHSENESSQIKKAKTSEQSSNVGFSKANRSAQKSRENAAAGSFDPVKREQWMQKIWTTVDPRAEFFPDDLRAIRCSRCGRKQIMPTLGNVHRQISPSTNPDDRILPCAECLSLLQLQEFKSSLRVPMPLDKNYRHVNKQWQNPILGEQFLKTAGLKELFDSVVSLSFSTTNSAN